MVPKKITLHRPDDIIKPYFYKHNTIFYKYFYSYRQNG